MDNFFKAADVLLEKGLNGLSVGRAYYAIYAISEFYAYKDKRLWPVDPKDHSKPADKFSHKFTTDIVADVIEHRHRRGATKRERHECKAWASQLLTQRMEADYRGYKDLGREAAVSLIAQARSLASEMLDEISHILNP